MSETLRVSDTATPTGAELIAAERRRQVDAEGWTPEHDDAHGDDELAHAAATYALPAYARTYRAPHRAPMEWPWEDKWFKPSPFDRIRELVKAGALIAAEIDRLQREEAQSAR